MQQEEAQAIALQALAWLGREADMLGHFLGATGLSQDQLRARLDDPELLAAVLDFLLMDDAWVMNCASEIGAAPDIMLRARQFLPGGDTPHWT